MLYTVYPRLPGPDTPPAFAPAAHGRLPGFSKDPGTTYGVYDFPRLWFFSGNWQEHPRRKELTRITYEETERILADMSDHGMNATSAPVTWKVVDGKPVAGGRHGRIDFSGEQVEHRRERHTFSSARRHIHSPSPIFSSAV